MNNLRGIVLMIVSMVFFSLGDMLIKWASATLSVGQIMAITGAGGGVLFMAMTWWAGHKLFARDFLHPVIMLRNGAEIVGTLTMMTALSRVDLAVVAAIIQATPLVVTLGAAVVLREHVGLRRWSATLIGFVGVLIIVRPGSQAFSPELLWPLVATVFLGLRDLVTRIVPETVPTLRISTYGMFMLLPTGLVLLATGQQTAAMSAPIWALMGAVIVSGVLGYYAVTSAMRVGEVSVVSPFRYSRMLFALVIAVFVFGEHPDFWTLLGTAITVLAGVYIFLREGRARRALALSSTPSAV